MGDDSHAEVPDPETIISLSVEGGISTLLRFGTLGSLGCRHLWRTRAKTVEETPKRWTVAAAGMARATSATFIECGIQEALSRIEDDDERRWLFQSNW